MKTGTRANTGAVGRGQLSRGRGTCRAGWQGGRGAGSGRGPVNFGAARDVDVELLVFESRERAGPGGQYWRRYRVSGG